MRKSYRQLQVEAKELGIKANQSYEVLDMLVTKHTGEDDVDAEYNALIESASEASAIDVDEDTAVEVSHPTFKYVRADNCVVVFLHNGVKTTIGWSKKDYKCYSYKVGSAPKLMMVQTAINVFKHYTNGRDGDVARIVKALTHIKCKPSLITAMEKKLKAQHAGVVERQKENASVTSLSRSYAGVVDPEWLRVYRQQRGENYDARLVRRDYEAYVNETCVHSAGVAQ